MLSGVKNFLKSISRNKRFNYCKIHRRNHIFIKSFLKILMNINKNKF